MWFIPTNLETILFDQLASHEITIVNSEKSQMKKGTEGEAKKHQEKKGLKGGGGGQLKFCLGEF